MNAVSRERFTPAAAADAVILACLRAPAPSILWLDAPLTRKECIVYRVSSMRTVADESGGWWPSVPASTPVPPAPRLLERSGTGTLTLCEWPLHSFRRLSVPDHGRDRTNFTAG